MFGRIKCLFGKHHRSRGRAHRVPGEARFVSNCVHCGVPMERLAKSEWRAVKGARGTRFSSKERT